MQPQPTHNIAQLIGESMLTASFNKTYAYTVQVCTAHTVDKYTGNEFYQGEYTLVISDTANGEIVFYSRNRKAPVKIACDEIRNLPQPEYGECHRAIIKETLWYYLQYAPRMRRMEREICAKIAQYEENLNR